jgi:hypothetical protein
MSNGREPKSCLGQIFNFKLDRFASEQHRGMTYTWPLSELKTRPRFYPVSWSFSHLIYKAQCVFVAISAVEIHTTGPISMKFGTVEDHDPGMAFMYV